MMNEEAQALLAEGRQEAGLFCEHCAAGEDVVTVYNGHWYHPRAVGKDPYGKLIMCKACPVWKRVDALALSSH